MFGSRWENKAAAAALSVSRGCLVCVFFWGGCGFSIHFFFTLILDMSYIIYFSIMLIWTINFIRKTSVVYCIDIHIYICCTYIYVSISRMQNVQWQTKILYFTLPQCNMCLSDFKYWHIVQYNAFLIFWIMKRILNILWFYVYDMCIYHRFFPVCISNIYFLLLCCRCFSASSPVFIKAMALYQPGQGLNPAAIARLRGRKAARPDRAKNGLIILPISCV